MNIKTVSILLACIATGGIVYAQNAVSPRHIQAAPKSNTAQLTVNPEMKKSNAPQHIKAEVSTTLKPQVATKFKVNPKAKAANAVQPAPAEHQNRKISRAK